MHICRRDLLTRAAVGAATLFLPDPRRRRGGARAQSLDGGPLVLTIEAANAWDTTFLIDPKVDPGFTPWTAGDIRTAPGTSIRYAPNILGDGTHDVYRVGSDSQDFFVKHGAKLLVMNGVDNATVSHDVGPRVAFSGSNRESVPTLAGLYAAARGSTLPLALMSTGGYVSSDGLVPITRASSTNVLLALTRPNSPAPVAGTGLFHDTSVFERIRARARLRDVRRTAAATVPREMDVLARVATTRSLEVTTEFDALAEALTGSAAVSSTNPLIPKAAAVLAAMSAGACAAAHIETDEGFDTHDNHDVDHPPAMLALLELLDFVFTTATEDPALAARGVLVVVGSDFGRTRYNDDAGKDHWPVTSMMVAGLGAASSLVEGGRVVGETATTVGAAAANGVIAAKVKHVDGDLVPTGDDDPLGFSLTAGHVHLALRDALGLSAHPLAARYPLTSVLPATPLPLLRRV